MKTPAIILLIALAVLAIIFWPYAIIWAVNTLFGFNIAYTFINWLAVLVLSATFGKTTVNTKK
jgi:hypothetical protein